MSRRVAQGVFAAVAAAVLAVGGGFYLLSRPHHAPAAFSLPTPVAASPVPEAALAGTWTVDAGSQAGYRVKERFVDQSADTEAVARTGAVSGKLVLLPSTGGLQLVSASFTADLTKLKSEDALATRGPANRDNFVGRIFLETAVYPNTTFDARPMNIAGSAGTGLEVPGTLTLHGVSHDARANLKVTRDGDRLLVVGTIPVHLADYRMDVPQTPFTQSSADGVVEVRIFLRRSA